tara:strand:+ start:156 stop:1199 length:1044 start_codon:yes stop_codon:yes gene_type:complete
MKRIKLEAILKVSDDIIIEDAMIQRTTGLLGEVESYNVNNNYDENKVNENNAASNNSQNQDGFSEITNSINSADKIYYGSLSLDERKAISLTIFIQVNFDKIKSDENYKAKIFSLFEKKFSFEKTSVEKILISSGESSNFDNFKNKFLEGDLLQIIIYIWEKVLSIGEEDDFEIELVEKAASSFGLEPAIINDTKKQGNDRAKIAKAIVSIESGKVPYNKLKAFEKTVLLGLMLSECSTIDSQISKENVNQLKRILSSQFGISNNAASVILEKKLNYSITEKVEKVEVYREKYDLVAFLWEKILSTEESINDGEMGLIRKWIRRLDISDVESEGARKDAMALLNPTS